LKSGVAKSIVRVVRVVHLLLCSGQEYEIFNMKITVQPIIKNYMLKYLHLYLLVRMSSADKGFLKPLVRGQVNIVEISPPLFEI